MNQAKTQSDHLRNQTGARYARVRTGMTSRLQSKSERQNQTDPHQAESPGSEYGQRGKQGRVATKTASPKLIVVSCFSFCRISILSRRAQQSPRPQRQWLAGFEGYGRRRRQRRQRVCHVGVGATARWLTRRASRKRGEKAREGSRRSNASSSQPSQPAWSSAGERGRMGGGGAGGTRGEFDDPRQPTRRRGPREQRGNSAATSRNARQTRARGEPARPSADRTGPHIASRAVLQPVRRARARTAAAFCFVLKVIRTLRANPLLSYIHLFIFTTAIRASDEQTSSLKVIMM